MNSIEFQFMLGQKVIIKASGISGEVITNSLSKSMTVARIGVEYVNNNGSVIEDYFDEDKLKPLFPKEEAK